MPDSLPDSGYIKGVICSHRGPGCRYRPPPIETSFATLASRSASGDRRASAMRARRGHGSVSVCDTASEVCQTRFTSTAGRPHAEHEASIKWMQFVPLHRRHAACSTRWHSSELHGRGADVLWATLSVPRASVWLFPVCAARHILARADARSGWLGTRSASAGAPFRWLDAFVQHVHSRLGSQDSGSFFLEIPRFIELPRRVGGDHFHFPWIAGARVMTNAAVR